jgi:aspartyl-tRNA(Asn)/glutamyl-tRNA(Gln) amidotransferase subunit A
MDLLSLSIEELHLGLKEKKFKVSDLVKASLEKAKATNGDLNAFVTIIEDALELAYKLDDQEVDNPLFGIPYSIKDNYSTKGVMTTGSSKILDGYVPVFNAEVVTRLNNANAINIGKTVLDELAMGGTGMNGHTGRVNNPWCKERNRQSGGSSGGSVASVSAGIVPFSIGSDTGDSVRKPAAYNGVVGFKPTWGRISRFGLFPFAPSIDHVAYFTRNVKDAAYLLEVLAGQDAKDMTCSTKKVEQYSKNLNGELKGKRIALIPNINNSIKDEKIVANFNETVEKLQSAGVEFKDYEIDIRLLKAILPVYLVISCAEATSNNANLDGVKFGKRVPGESVDEMTINTRSEGFSELVKRRFILGSYCLAKENKKVLFERAQKIRRLIVEAVLKVLDDADAILFPAAGSIAPLFEGGSSEKLSENYLIAENHMAIGNFAGLPSITIPCGFVDNMPVGINITCRAFEEQETLNIAYGIENVLGYKNQVAKGE